MHCIFQVNSLSSYSFTFINHFTDPGTIVFSSELRWRDKEQNVSILTRSYHESLPLLKTPAICLIFPQFNITVSKSIHVLTDPQLAQLRVLQLNSLPTSCHITPLCTFRHTHTELSFMSPSWIFETTKRLMVTEIPKVSIIRRESCSSHPSSPRWLYLELLRSGTLVPS